MDGMGWVGLDWITLGGVRYRVPSVLITFTWKGPFHLVKWKNEFIEPKIA